MIEPHYTPADVARLLKISESTVLRACRRGEIRSFVVPGGRARRIPESAVEAWLHAGGEGRSVTGSVVNLRRRA